MGELSGHGSTVRALLPLSMRLSSMKIDFGETRENLIRLRHIYNALVHRVRVLLLERNEAHARRAARTITDLVEADTYVAGTSKDAIPMLSGPLDFIWTDLTLHDSEGVDVARLIRRYHPHTPVVVATELRPDAELLSELKTLGIFIVLDKPATADEIRLVLRLMRVHTMPCLDCPKLEHWRRLDAER